MGKRTRKTTENTTKRFLYVILKFLEKTALILRQNNIFPPILNRLKKIVLVMEDKAYITRRISDYSKNTQMNRTLSTLSTGSLSSSSVTKIDSRPAVVIEIGNRLTR